MLYKNFILQKNKIIDSAVKQWKKNHVTKSAHLFILKEQIIDLCIKAH